MVLLVGFMVLMDKLDVNIDGELEQAPPNFRELADTIRGALSGILGVTAQELPQTTTDLLLHTIRSVYLPRLLRTSDTPEQAYMTAEDPKMPNETVVYVDAADDVAFRMWSEIAKKLPPEKKLSVRTLTLPLDAERAHELSKTSGFLSLAHEPGLDGEERMVTYVVPGGRFNEVYGWDTDFIAMGLIAAGKLELVRGLIKHHLVEIQLYGRVLNANRTYYLTRGQPPLFMHLVRSYAESLAPKERLAQRAFLQECVRAGILEYETVWTKEPHLTANGLSRYFDPRKHFPPETEPGHFDMIVQPYADAAGITVEAYMQGFNDGTIANSDLTAFVMHDGAVRESGHDTTNALVGNAAHLNPTCLNSMLAKAEEDTAALLRTVCDGVLQLADRVTTPKEWEERLEKRKTLMQDLLWNKERGCFDDYNIAEEQREPYTSPRNLLPLWAGVATPEQARHMVENILPLLEFEGGLASSDEASRGPVTPEHPQRQWDYPAGWAPHQMLVWDGLERYGFHDEAQRLIYKWLHMITKNWLRTRRIVEKYDVVTATEEFHAEYGNVGADMDLEEGAGFGWTNASYERGMALLDEQYRDDLHVLRLPSEVFPHA